MEFYVLFEQRDRNTRTHKRYPELRHTGWVTIKVSDEPGDDINKVLAEEDKARQIATDHFGTAWTYLSGQLSFDDFRHGELMRIEHLVAPGITNGYEIVKRTRFHEDGTSEPITGMRLLMTKSSVFAEPGYKPVRFGATTMEPQAGIDILRDAETSAQSSAPGFLVRTWDGLWAWVGNPSARPDHGRLWVDVAGLAEDLEPFGSYEGMPKAER